MSRLWVELYSISAQWLIQTCIAIHLNCFFIIQWYLYSLLLSCVYICVILISFSLVQLLRSRMFGSSWTWQTLQGLVTRSTMRNGEIFLHSLTLTHTLSHSLIHPLTLTHTHTLTHTLIFSHTHLPTHLLTHSPTHLPTTFTHTLTITHTYSLSHSFTHSLTLIHSLCLLLSCYSWQPILEHVNDQFERYLNEEVSVTRKRTIPDTRVHCCLYFIAPTGHK